jgi:hypothetical protein
MCVRSNITVLVLVLGKRYRMMEKNILCLKSEGTAACNVTVSVMDIFYGEWTYVNWSWVRILCLYMISGCVKNSDSVLRCLVEAGRSDYVKEEQRPVGDTQNCL